MVGPSESTAAVRRAGPATFDKLEGRSCSNGDKSVEVWLIRVEFLGSKQSFTLRRRSPGLGKLGFETESEE